MDSILATIPLGAQIAAVLFLIICVILILLVLIQKGRGGGLAAAFGGAGGQSAFGSKTGDVLTWVTIAAAALFLIFSIGLTMTYKPEAVEEHITPVMNSAAPAAPTAPATETPAAPADNTAAPAPAEAPAAPAAPASGN